MSNLNHSNDPSIGRRRSQRVIISIPVTVRWQGPDGQEVEEATASVVLNAHGALLPLASELKKGQTLRLINQTTNREQMCRVVHIGPGSGGKTHVGLEFLQPAPEFWNISFPPDSWPFSKK